MVKFFLCEHCKNMVDMIFDSGVPMMCCGQKMTALVPNSVEAVTEKHIPVVSISGNTVTVTVGSVLHPMLAEHHIAWIALETTAGVYRKALEAGKEPVAVFTLTDEKPITAYEFCNLHGLWKKDI
ncbi:MAG: desulfoferrodoxin family protein [Oscillospiraceae bacterium]